jgi:hypothetical protein
MASKFRAPYQNWEVLRYLDTVVKDHKVCSLQILETRHTQMFLRCWRISNRAWISCNAGVTVILRLAVYRQISLSWRQTPWGSRSEISFCNWTLAVIILMQHPLWREDGFVSYELASSFVKCTYCIYSMLLKILPCALYTNQSTVSTGFAKQIMSIIRSLSYNGSLVTWTVVRLTAAKFNPLIFSTSGFAFPIPWPCSFLWFCMTSALSCPVQVQVQVTFRLTVSQSVCLGVEPRPGLMTRY